MAARICILDYGMGNLRSVEKALEHVGAEATIASDPAAVRGAAGLILPGVGAFPRAMERIHELGIDDLIDERRNAGVPILGICLGLQLLFDSTTELGGATGLGLLSGEVAGLDADGLKVPHIGWSPVTWTRESRLTEGIESGTGRCASTITRAEASGLCQQQRANRGPRPTRAGANGARTRGHWRSSESRT